MQRPPLLHAAKDPVALQNAVVDKKARTSMGCSPNGKAVVMHRRRQSISWLTVVAKELGHDAIERIKNTWPTVFSKELQIG